MSVEIKEINELRELKKFVDFPHNLYRGNPYYVPALRTDELNTLRRDKNPAFEFCRAKYWMASIDGKPAGRVAGIINPRHIERWNQPYARFGWLDFNDDPEVLYALMMAVEDWARDNGLRAIHGPLGFTDLDREGMLVEGFSEPGTLATIYNHPYYPEYLERAGYIGDTDWVEYEIRVPEKGIEKISLLAEKVQKRYGLKFLEAENKRAMLPYAMQLFELLDDAYRHLYGVTPLSRAQMEAYVKQYFSFLSPEFVPVVLDADDSMVAFGIAMPSLSRALQKSGGRIFPFGFIHLLKAMKKNDRGDLYLVAVKPEYQGRGVNAMLINRMIETFNRFGIRTVESNPELMGNLQVQAQWKHFEHRQHKRRRCYIKYLD